MYRALAAIHHDHAIELPAWLVEDNFIVADKRIPADTIGPEIRLHVMPVHARTADRHRSAARSRLRIGVAHDVDEHIVHAVVVIKEAVADPQDRLRCRRLCALGLRLRQCRIKDGHATEQHDNRHDATKHEVRLAHDVPLKKCLQKTAGTNAAHRINWRSPARRRYKWFRRSETAGPHQKSPPPNATHRRSCRFYRRGYASSNDRPAARCSSPRDSDR